MVNLFQFVYNISNSLQKLYLENIFYLKEQKKIKKKNYNYFLLYTGKKEIVVIFTKYVLAEVVKMVKSSENKML